MNPHVAKSLYRCARSAVGQGLAVTRDSSLALGGVHDGNRYVLADPTVGIQTVWPYSGTASPRHHNSEDRPETVDARSLHDLVAINASFLYYVASAGGPEARWLAGIALDRGYEQVLAAREKGVDQVAYAVDRETESILSVLRAGSGKRANWPARIAATVNRQPETLRR